MPNHQVSTRPALVVVSGAPGTGKTSIGRFIPQRLEAPFLNKDLIKESLFDSLGVKDREWSRKLGIASIDLLFGVAEAILVPGNSLVIESNFHREYDPPRVRRTHQPSFVGFN
ncbi:MAG: hypothetical protein O3B84_05200 [Chloroflexi bacterium]|nr:hypothetical protein [Chloroflexota bacterium]